MSTRTRQEVYDRVTTHLRLQGRQSLDANGSCAYRGKGGRRCAIGIFIDEVKYDPVIEGMAVESLLHYLQPEVAATGSEFLSDLQLLHDVGVTMVGGAFYVPDLESKLHLAADKWRLTYSAPASRG